MFGLTEKEILILKQIIGDHHPIVWGSRAKGKYWEYSDLDLCFKEEVSRRELARMKYEFEESNLGIVIDVSEYSYLPDYMKEAVDKDGIVFN